MIHRLLKGFSTAEFVVVMGLLATMAAVFVMTTKNLHIDASILTRMPSLMPLDMPLGQEKEPATLHHTPQQPFTPETNSSSSSSGMSIPSDTSCIALPTIDRDGGITPAVNVTAHVEALGSESTVGYRGPRVDVHASISTDNGATWRPLFALKAIRGGESDVVSNISGGGRMLLTLEGRYGWSYQKKVTTGEGDSHILVLTAGDSIPAAILSTPSKPFLQSILTSNGHIAGEEGDIIILAELDDPAAGDFQDAVLRIRFEKQECLPPEPIL
jgi:hypothetical protein